MRSPDRLIKLSEEMRKPRELFIKWSQVVDRYKRGKEWKLATLIVKMDGKSAEAKKQQALASDEWKQYLDEWDNASKEKATAQVRVENLQTDFEALQSALSFDKVKLGKLGG